MSDNRGPWGSGGGSGDGGGAGGGSGDEGGTGGGSGDGGSGGGPRSPWGQPGPRRRRPGGPAGKSGGEVTSLDDWLKRSRDRVRRGFPSGGGKRRPYWLYGIVALALLWLLFTSIHRVEIRERGVITTFGRYQRTVGPGIAFTWPAPFSRFERVQVEEIRDVNIPGQSGRENLILTGDQNVIDVAYTVRWNVKSPQLYLFQLRDPDSTIAEVAESAMRQTVARATLEDVLGAGKNEIEQRVQQSIQQMLDEYGAGILIQGVSIRQAQPPAAVNDAFLEVSAAQQRAQSVQNEARAYALQRTAQAQGDAEQFDQILRQYRLAPEVTRRRLYYETMEQILSRVDKTIVQAPGVTPYLALPELQRRSQQPAAPAEAAPSAQTAQPQAQGPAR